MPTKSIIQTTDAPQAIGPYSQAVKFGDTVFLSGQIPLDPATMTMVGDSAAEQAEQVFKNLAAVAAAAGGSLDDALKVNISLTDLNDFVSVNEVMAKHFSQPYPARACVQVAALPKGAKVEVEVILGLSS
ncbi:MAG TPA: reactive intermediate/imine deaminase [Spongiibacteraceae bacterium]|nr:reactive intermediate/imine deaminase [Spongiibacteraceae bacterium]HCS26111.1 reactive intermediate/imine deaminase [Spongiibacteraceae bacterium]|tara:strand:+ start:289 stop:678 length:390 start_codon:yes stop_codon:yes gene_type:complete